MRKKNGPNSESSRKPSGEALANDASNGAETDVTRRVISGLSVNGFLPLDVAVSILAFGSPVDPANRNGPEEMPQRAQSLRVICDAAFNDDVRLKGTRDKQGGKAQWIPFGYFELPRALTNDLNSLGSDYERMASETWGEVDAMSPDLFVAWFDVEIEAPSFAEWLEKHVSVEKRDELRRKQSSQLFEHPLWSGETALCWIAFRSVVKLTTDGDKAARQLRMAVRRLSDQNGYFESQPEILLLQALRAGRLKGLVNGVALPALQWIDCQPHSLALSLAPSVQFARNEVLRLFPDEAAQGASRSRPSRALRIKRIEHWLQTTKRWISCAAIADRYARNSSFGSLHVRRRIEALSQLRASFVRGEFHRGGKSGLMQLRSDTAIVRVNFEPVSHALESEDFGEDATSGGYLEQCWLPQEICHIWFEQNRLAWPPQFGEKRQRFNENSASKKKAASGRKTDWPIYEAEFKRITQCRSPKDSLKEEATLLLEWGNANPAIKRKIQDRRLQDLLSPLYNAWTAKKRKNVK
jgi:hypothetical protein